jgi:hypothetical protein
MAHFAEIDRDNKVLRVVVGCNQDIANNGGEQSIQAAEHFKTVCPLSENGVKWIQTSYNNNFRKQYAVRGMYYDENKDKFILSQPYSSWTLDSNNDWKAPIARPNIFTKPNSEEFIILPIKWDESNQRWLSDDNQYVWNSSNNSWDLA